MYVVMPWHNQGWNLDSLEHLFGHPQAYVGTVEQRIDGVPHYLGKVLWVHSFQSLTVPCIILGPLWGERGKPVFWIESVDGCLDALAHSYLGTLEELHCQVGLADETTSDVGGEYRPHPLRVTEGASQGNGRSKRASSQIGPLD